MGSCRSLAGGIVIAHISGGYLCCQICPKKLRSGGGDVVANQSISIRYRNGEMCLTLTNCLTLPGWSGQPCGEQGMIN